MVSTLSGLARADQDKITAAVAAAQARSEARLAFVVVPASDRYQLYPIIWGAAFSFLLMCALALGAPHVGFRLGAIFTLAAFLLSSLLLEWRPLRMRIVPRRVKHGHAHAFAHREFAARILSHRERQGGVLFFVSLAERYSEVIADHTLHKEAGQAAWDKIVADFTASAASGRIADGAVSGAKACGDLLAQHRPKG